MLSDRRSWWVRNPPTGLLLREEERTTTPRSWPYLKGHAITAGFNMVRIYAVPSGNFATNAAGQAISVGYVALEFLQGQALRQDHLLLHLLLDLLDHVREA